MDQPLPVELYDLRLLRTGHASLLPGEDRASLQDTDGWTLYRCEHEAGPELRPPRATDASFSRRPSQAATHLASWTA